VLARHGAVSAAVVEQMAIGALRASGADLALAVSGVAGPDGGAPGKPVGLVHFAVLRRGSPVEVSQQHFPGDRAAVRRAAVERALQLIAEAALIGAGAHESGARGKI